MKAHNSLYFLVTNFCKIQHKFVAFFMSSHFFSNLCVFSHFHLFSAGKFMLESRKAVPESIGCN